MIDIKYSCEDFAVVIKPYGMISEPDTTGRPSVPDEISKELKIPLSSVFTVHRLDATTEGLMVYALNSKAAAKISETVRLGLFHKEYIALISASPDLPQSGLMQDFLFYDRKQQKSFISKPEKKDAKEASLSYTLGESFLLQGDTVTPAYIALKTGRTHQIRVQFASRRSPLIGDGKYGSRIKRNAPSLYSVSLSFPWNGETLKYSYIPEILQQ